MARRYRVHHGHHHHRHHNRHHYRRHRNPLMPDKGTIVLAAWGVAGGVGAQAIPAVVLPSQNTGFIGYLLNFGSAIALKIAGDFVSREAGDGMLIGGLVATGLRIVKDQLGSKIPGLGAYWQSYLPNFPAASNPWGQMANPNPPAPAPASTKTMSGGRFTNGRFAMRGR